MPTPFVHLHNHSEFSLLDGASKLKDIVKYAVENEMPAIALTDALADHDLLTALTVLCPRLRQ